MGKRKDQFTRGVNPSQAKIEWKGADDKGYFSFYTKESGEQPLESLKFAILAERHAVGGYSERHNTGTFSNEVDRIGEEILIVRKSVGGEKQELCRGIYKEIGRDLAYHQVKYQKIIYAMILECDQIKRGTIVKLSLSGASVSAWFDLIPEDKLKAILWDGYTDEKKGTNKYRKPVFKAVDISENEDNAAEERYATVEAYINAKAAPTAKPEVESNPEELPPVDEVEGSATDDVGDIPF